MSVRVMSWVWEHSRSKGNDRLVLLAIADFAQDDGRNAYPSVASLCGKTILSRRTVQRSLEALVAGGELSVDRNAGRGGANMYRVLMGGRQIDTGAKLTPAPERHPRQDDAASDCHEGGVNLAPGGRQDDAQPVIEPSKNHQERAPETKPKVPRSTDDPLFSEFWRTYPKRVGKVDAFKKFVAVLKAGTDPQAVIEGARRYAAKCRRDGTADQFVAHPATWLNQGRWDDEPTVATAHAKQVSGGW